MGRVELPYIEPMFSTYHWLSSAGIAAKQNPTSDVWFYNNMIEWSCSTRFLNGFTTPELSVPTGSIWSIPFLEKSGVNNRFARRCSIDIIKTMLDDGFYVAFGGVDDFYIKGKSWYNERHFSHDGLILGYDEEKETFTMAAYDERWIFTTFETPQKCFLEGLEALTSQNQFGSIHAIKAKQDVQKLDIANIKEVLGRYLASNIKDYPLTHTEKVWGIIVYDYIHMYLDKLMDGSIPHEKRDRRIFRLIWEHKKCMLNRIITVENEYGLGDELSRQYIKIVEHSDKARFLYSKFVVKYSAKHLEKIQKIIQDIKREEKIILNQFQTILEKQLSEVKKDA